MRKKTLIAFIFANILFFTHALQIFAATCDGIAVTPTTVIQGDTVTVTKAGGLINADAMTLRVTTTEGSEVLPFQNVGCEWQEGDWERVCNTGEEDIFTIPTASLIANNTYYVQVRFYNGLDWADCSFSFTTTTGATEFCPNTGLASINPPEGDESTNFTVTGCVGAGFGGSPCNGNSRVLIQDVNSGIGSNPSLDLPITNSGGGNACNPDGTFTLLTPTMPYGIYRAILKQGTGDVGSPIQFRVLDGGDPEPGQVCTFTKNCVGAGGGAGTQRCVGVIEGVGAARQCVESSCSRCNYCGDSICEEEDIEAGCSLDCRIAGIRPIEFDCASPNGRGIDTAIGCIPITSINATVQFFIRWSVGIVGGIAILVFIYSFLEIGTSRANPDQLASGKDRLTSAIAAVLMVVFCLVLLRLIGVNILSVF